MNQIILKNTFVTTARSAALKWAAIGAACLLCHPALGAPPAIVADEVVPPQSADPSTPYVTESTSHASQLKLLCNKSVVLETKTPYKRVSVGQPDVADVNLLGPGKILVTGKKAGTTQVIVWDDGDKAQVIDVSVQVDVAGLQDQLKKLWPGVKVEVAANNGEVVLKGSAPSLEIAEQIVIIARPYGTAVHDFLKVSGGQQVMLSVRFAEVSRSATDALGINGAFAAEKFAFGSNVGLLNPTALVPGQTAGSNVSAPGSAVTLYGSGKVGSVLVEGFVQALRQNNLLRILAEPNLIAISGQEASFLAGGAIPIPVSQGGTGSGAAISVDYREYGVKLKFVPIILGDGRIRLKVSPEISDLDYGNGVSLGGFVIPGMTQRKVTTTVELADGQTFALAGLLNTSVATNKDVTPLLGDLPVIGAMFRTVHYSRKETEMVVLVTPHLVEPLNPADQQRLPGEEWRTPTENELFWNQDLGGDKNAKFQPPAAPATDAHRHPPKFRGQFGFVPAGGSSSEKTPPAPFATTGRD